MAMTYSEFMKVYDILIWATIDKRLNPNLTCDDMIVAFYTAEPNETHWNRQFRKNYTMRKDNISDYDHRFDQCFFKPMENLEFLEDI